MIDAGEIFACIDSEKSMVRFLGDPEQYASPAMVQRLDAAIQQSTALAERVSAVAHAVRPSEQQHCASPAVTGKSSCSYNAWQLSSSEGSLHQQVSMEKSYVQKVHLKERHGRYEDPLELVSEPASLGYDV